MKHYTFDIEDSNAPTVTKWARTTFDSIFIEVNVVLKYSFDTKQNWLYNIHIRSRYEQTLGYHCRA